MEQWRYNMSTHIELNNIHGTKVKLINSDTNNLGA